MEMENNIFARASAPNSPTPPVYAGLENITQPQLAERHRGGHGDCTPLGAIPRTVEQQSSWTAAPTMYAGPLPQGGIMQPVHLHGQAGAYSQGQYNSVPAPRLPDGQSLRFVGVLNGGVLYKVPEGHFALPVPAVPPLNTSSSKKRKREKEQSNERLYVKKPPNAFMLFMKEHRANVGAELQGRGSAAINTVLGQIWNSLTKEEQAKCFRQTETERVLHVQRHPEWSPSDNYGKKRKRERSKKAPTCACASPATAV